MKVSVDQELCIGSGNCVYLAEGVFDLDDYDVAEVIDPNAAPLEQLEAAARACPASAITIESGKEQP